MGGTKGYLAIGGGVLALIAGVLLVVTRYHESRKARAEADRAAREARGLGDTPPPVITPTPDRVPANSPGSVPKTPEGTSFAAFEGKWSVKYANGYTHEYIVTSKGEIFFEKCINPDNKSFVKPDEKRGHLERYRGDVLAYFSGGKIIERLTLKNGTLTVERFDPASTYPDRPGNRGTGTKFG